MNDNGSFLILAAIYVCTVPALLQRRGEIVAAEIKGIAYFRKQRAIGYEIFPAPFCVK
ncbi:MAG: hypothetical protein JSR78_19875 [Proteobacteria bacterium]|nr:hypothetical protein [Pseudomonadota bacterium]